MGKPRHRRVVPETYVQLLYEYLDARDCDPEPLLGHSWPTPEPDALGGIPAVRWGEMLEIAEAHLADPLIALHVGQTINPRHLGILGAVLLACGSVGEALQRYERYQRLIFDVVPMSTAVALDGLELKWDTQEYVPGRLVVELGFAVMAQMLRSLARGKASPLAVMFLHTGPDDTSAYDDFFGCPVHFGQPESIIRIDPAILSLPLKSPDPDLVALLDRHAEALLSKLPQDDELIERVRREIVQRLHHGEPDIEVVAAKLACSPRTLQRKLNSAGTNFRRELNVVRHELAHGYLRDRRLKVIDIALLLGYSEHSAFTRAFREWTGKSPEQERNGMKGCA
jgi:AraC-like DNA-binding protein